MLYPQSSILALDRLSIKHLPASSIYTSLCSSRWKILLSRYAFFSPFCYEMTTQKVELDMLGRSDVHNEEGQMTEVQQPSQEMCVTESESRSVPVQKGKAPRESSCPWSHLHLELGIKTARTPQICFGFFFGYLLF